MLRNILGNKNVHYIFMFLYSIVVVSLPTNKPGLSLGIGALGIVTFFLTPFIEFQKSFVRKRSLKWMLLLFFFQILSILWSNNSAEGWHFIVLTLPFYALFFSLCVHPVNNRKERDFLMILFTFTVLICSFINVVVYKVREPSINFDIRDMSLFTSHIRFSLMIVISIVISTYFFLNIKKYSRWIFVGNILYFLYYLIISEVISGFVSLLAIIIALVFYLLTQYIQSRTWRLILTYSFGFLILSCISYPIFLLQNRQRIVIKDITDSGNYYQSFPETIKFENGNPIDINVCKKELYQQWQKRSSISLDSIAPNHSIYMVNLVRYMTSKGLSKDSLGFSKMTTKDIKNVENGILSIVELMNPVERKWIGMKDELMSINIDPNGYTMLQRFLYWKAGWNIFKENPIVGVGVGGVKTSFANYYTKTNSKLLPQNRLTSHQQYLANLVSVGIIGFSFFMLLLVDVIKESRRDLFSLLIIVVLLTSFLNEDTIETIAGASLCAFFMGLFGSGFDRLDQQNRLEEQKDKKHS